MNTMSFSMFTVCVMALALTLPTQSSGIKWETQVGGTLKLGSEHKSEAKPQESNMNYLGGGIYPKPEPDDSSFNLDEVINILTQMKYAQDCQPHCKPQDMRIDSPEIKSLMKSYLNKTWRQYHPSYPQYPSPMQNLAKCNFFQRIRKMFQAIIGECYIESRK